MIAFVSLCGFCHFSIGISLRGLSSISTNYGIDRCTLILFPVDSSHLPLINANPMQFLVLRKALSLITISYR